MMTSRCLSVGMLDKTKAASRVSTALTLTALTFGIVFWSSGKAWALTEASALVAPEILEPHARLNQEWQVASLSKDAGLSRRNLADVAFEPDGTAWIAASNGLYRYDGYAWQKFSTEHGLPSAMVRSVLRTSKGELWVGTDNGAGVFDGKTFDRRGSDKGLSAPSVKKMAEDPDGTLWFWCDQVDVGGLTSFRAGRWRAYHKQDGLPSEKVRAYFRDSKGRQFALTKEGIAQLSNDKWVVADTPGCKGGENPYAMSEDTEGVLAPCNEGVLRFRNDRWELAKVPTPTTNNGVPPQHHYNSILRTQDGTLFIIGWDLDHGNTLHRWTPQGFVRASPILGRWSQWVQTIREAPDGSIWVLGDLGLLARWQRKGAEWTGYDRLPVPSYVDAEGHVVFHGSATFGHFDVVPGTFTFGEDQKFHALPSHQPPESLDADGVKWAIEGDATLVASSQGKTIARHEGKQWGLQRISALIMDAKHNPWFVGIGDKGAASVMFRSASGWQTAPGSSRLPTGAIYGAKPDNTHGIWLLIHLAAEHKFVLALVDETSCELHSVDFDPRGADSKINFQPDRLGNVWVFAETFRGLLFRSQVRSGDQPAFRVPDFTDLVSFVVATDSTTWFTFADEARPGGSLMALRKDGWHSYLQDRVQHSALSYRDTIVFENPEKLYITKSGATDGPTPLSLFAAREPGTAALVDKAGDLWVGLDDTPARDSAIFRYHADGVPPDTVIVEANAKVASNARFRAQIVGIERFVPKRNQRTFRFSWRIDSQPWSTFTAFDSAGLSVSSLPLGKHSFEVRAQDEGLDVDPTPARFVFSVVAVPLEERSWFKPAVYVVFLTVLALALLALDRARKLGGSNKQLGREIGVRREAEQALQQAHGQLELRVEQRTAELSAANVSLTEEVRERLRAEGELKEAHKQLIVAAREAGMAEIATGVLHNVGNVLNSINISTTIVEDGLANSKVVSVGRLSKMFEAHADDLGPFLTTTPEGRQIPGYLQKLATHLETERDRLLGEVRNLSSNVDHVKEIVSVQQNYARNVFVAELVEPASLIDDVLRMQSLALGRHNIVLKREIADLPTVLLDRHRILQILINLIGNAKQALDGVPESERNIHIKVDQIQDPAMLRFCVSDTGIGISPENLARVFNHGFTTKKNGHGFGLHASNISAKEMHGSLTASSEGVGKGATFTLQVPLNYANAA